jgi:hypothetical protein
MSFFIFLGCLVAVNIWVTRRVRRAADLDHKGLHIAMVWIAPMFGALFTHWHIRPYERQADASPLPASRQDDPGHAPRVLTAPGVPPFALTEHIAAPNGFAIPDWRAVHEWLGTIADDRARRGARLQSHRAWLMHLHEGLGPHFWLYETDDAFVLSSLEEPVARAAGKYISQARRKVAQVLGGLAHFAEGEKSVLLVLDDETWYYHYIAIYYPEQGEFAFSGGMFIDAGCPHFVVPRGDLAAIEPVIAHELTHSALAHLKLPLWLDEGIAVNTERKIAPTGRGLYTPHEIHAKHLRFWGPAEIQQFWSGRSFARTDDGNLLSYELARAIVEQLARSWESFERFVKDARREDAGAAAAAEHLGVDLGAYVCALFDKADPATWSPPRVEAQAAGS